MFRKMSVIAVLLAILMAAPAAQARLKINKIRYDPPGADYQTASQLRAEYIVIHNTSSHKRRLRHWKIKDRSGHTYRFPRYTIFGGGYVTVHTGSGRDRRGDLYWGSSNFIWNNDGDTGKLLTPRGRVKDACSYNGGPSPNPPANC